MGRRHPRADGHKITRADDLSTLIAKHKVGEPVVLDVVRGGKPMKLRVTVAIGQGRKVVGVLVSPRFTFPFKVNVDTRDIGGPSAGLAMTLSIFDDLTPGNLTGGARVAVTGTIDAAGNVGEIGGIQQKAVAARAAGGHVVHRPAVLAAGPAHRSRELQDRPGRGREARGRKDCGETGVDVHAGAPGTARRRRRSCHTEFPDQLDRRRLNRI